MNKVVNVSEAVEFVKDGDTIMVGGFAGFGAANDLIEAIIEKKVKNLTLISNCTATPDKSLGKMVIGKQFKKVIVSHIGTNPETQRQVQEGTLELELVPQGTLVERIRCGGSGLGGFLTKAGVGTEVEEGKQTLTVDGEKYLLETPLKADVCVIKCHKADRMGNLVYRGTAFAHSLQMATAAKITIAQADEIVEVGELDPNSIHTQSIFVNYVVQGGKN